MQKTDSINYEVKRIQRMDEVIDCNLFHINYFQWTAKYKPEAYGRMGLIESYGLIISMTVIETNPLRRYYLEDDPVYKDSAVEAFMDFMPGRKMGYLNFEMNSNGALPAIFIKSVRIQTGNIMQAFRRSTVKIRISICRSSLARLS